MGKKIKIEVKVIDGCHERTSFCIKSNFKPTSTGLIEIDGLEYIINSVSLVIDGLVDFKIQVQSVLVPDSRPGTLSDE